jgi:hypothetical protein
MSRGVSRLQLHALTRWEAAFVDTLGLEDVSGYATLITHYLLAIFAEVVKWTAVHWTYLHFHVAVLPSCTCIGFLMSYARASPSTRGVFLVCVRGRGLGFHVYNYDYRRVSFLFRRFRLKTNTNTATDHPYIMSPHHHTATGRPLQI